MSIKSLYKLPLLAAVLLATAASAQKTFTHQDSLRGSIGEGRSNWDLGHYDLRIKVNPKDSSISGSNFIHYRLLAPPVTHEGGQEYVQLQVDLQPPMKITKATENGNELEFTNDGNAWFINVRNHRIGISGSPHSHPIRSLAIYFEGKPQVAVMPPWGGGLVWSRDENNKPFIATACQGDGASLWWPCKDHQYDEPDSMHISYTVPTGLTAVGNGRLQSVKENKDSTTTFNWVVHNPINNYGVNMNIAEYAHFSEKYKGLKGELDCDYYVLPYNLEKAKKQFAQVKMMLDAFEYWFGPYPFYEDGYKLVEVPYLGMEHQSSVTYGNGYKNGYRGRDLSGTGVGLKFDFIIVHESGHEWFGNSITSRDIADMWIHESFTSYSENLYVEQYWGKKEGAEYVTGKRRNVQNDKPVIGIYNVNNHGSGDMYYKGENMLHTLRQWVNDDKKWLGIMRGINKEFYHQTVTTLQVEAYLAKQTGLDLTAFFNQYLRSTKIPQMEYTLNGNVLKYRWTNIVEGFDMPMMVMVNGKDILLKPTAEWKEMKLDQPADGLVADMNWYATVMQLDVK